MATENNKSIPAKSKRQAVSAAAKAASDPFLVRPYLQLGEHFSLTSRQFYEVNFHTADMKSHFQVQYRASESASWQNCVGLWHALVRVEGKHTAQAKALREHYRYRALVGPVPPGGTLFYRVLQEEKVVFQSQALVEPDAHKPWRFCVAGDIGDGGMRSRSVAHAIYQAKPHLYLIPGDLVYDRGLVSEYLKNFFPVLNARNAGARIGAPLLSSVMTVAAAGNHDVGTPKQTEALDWEKYPDLFGFFLFWSQSANGPAQPQGLMSKLFVRGKNRKRMGSMIGNAVFEGSNFHFRYGNIHFVVLDANRHMDWSKPALRKWLEDALKAGADADFRIVSFHQPPFNSDFKYRGEQRMRIIADILEAGKVDLVFCGHCHYYERSKPIKFVGNDRDENGVMVVDAKYHVEGQIACDELYNTDTGDGVKNTDPDGIIYVISGAASELTDDTHLPRPQSFTAKLDWQHNSYTVVDVDGKKLTVRQVAVDGTELDRFTIERGKK